MAARRQPSTSSLSKYVRESSPGLQNRSLDFCNAFWGAGDGGVDVLFARMRGATRTMEELRNFWKERAAIEEDYAKRLGKLSKVALGKDEIGELRNSLDTIRLETEKQAGYHAKLASDVRTELENTSAAFHTKQLHYKKTFQAGIEKEFKNKQAQEGHVNKAREKYEQDCVRINSYTAQSSLVQGKDLEKVTLKLERAQQTVQANERDFANFAKILQETVARWEQDWKAFADSCQDLEEQRMEFMKDNMWAFANAVSTVCVADDESCEKMRVALEQMEPEKDMENFVRDYGTGNQIPDPPAFVNYNTPDAIPSSSSQPTFHIAQFVRTSQREPVHHRQNSMPPPEDHDIPQINTAGIGAVGRRESQYGASLNRHVSRRQSAMATQQPPQPPNGHSAIHTVPGPGPSSSASSQLVRHNTRRQSVSPAPGSGSSPSPSGQVVRHSTQQSRSYRVPPQDPYAEPMDPNAETYIKIGDNAYKADPNKDPQMQTQNQSGLFNPRPAASSPTKAIASGAVDPLAKHMEDLKNAVSSTGSTRRKSVRRSNVPDAARASQQLQQPHQQSSGTHSPALTPPPSTMSNLAIARGSSPSRDYRNSAELVVGLHPSASAPAQQTSRPSSPNPPTAEFMKPPTASGSEVIREVLTDYHQSLPGERKSISRSNSPIALERRLSIGGSQQRQGQGHGHGHSASQSSIGLGLGHQGQGQGQGHMHTQGQGQNLARPSSSVGHPGIGAHGSSRSNSPQPPSRQPSPAPPSSARSRNSVMSGNGNGNGFISAPAGPGVVRAPSPNTVGIALDPTGRVLHDEMAQRYQQQQRQPPTQQMPPQQQHQFAQHPAQQHSQYAPPQPQQQQPQTRRTSYMAPSPVPPPPPPLTAYTVAPAPVMYQAPPPAPAPAPVVTPANTRPGYVQQQPVQAQPQQPMYTGYQTQTPAPVAPLAMTLYSQQQQQQQQPSQQVGYQQPQQVGYYGQQPHVAQQQLQIRAPYQQQQQQPYGGYRGPSPVAQRTPSPQPPVQQGGQLAAPPTGQTTEDGQAILFYVKALYDYTATIDEEFDFQTGDIIAVTQTPEDGWWSGELLDEDRRQRGRHVFPSNFVCLF
ncbi:hypothetical protein H0H87_010567 [Tephrocybe sp. NHM501043]|nr:hypothetical protein H0H87_010567 [Tephrocybe sp. NHM501043]